MPLIINFSDVHCGFTCFPMGLVFVNFSYVFILLKIPLTAAGMSAGSTIIKNNLIRNHKKDLKYNSPKKKPAVALATEDVCTNCLYLNI